VECRAKTPSLQDYERSLVRRSGRADPPYGLDFLWIVRKRAETSQDTPEL